jgi:hypothetical protein
VGQGRQKGRLAEAHAGARVSGSAAPLGGGAHLLMALSEQEDEQGLQEVVRQRGGIHLRSYDALDDKAVGPCLGILKQFLRTVFSETQARR